MKCFKHNDSLSSKQASKLGNESSRFFTKAIRNCNHKILLRKNLSHALCFLTQRRSYSVIQSFFHERCWERRQRIAVYPAAGFKPDQNKLYKEVPFFLLLLSCHFLLFSWLCLKEKKLVPMAIITCPLLRDDQRVSHADFVNGQGECRKLEAVCIGLTTSVYISSPFFQSSVVF